MDSKISPWLKDFIFQHALSELNFCYFEKVNLGNDQRFNLVMLYEGPNIGIDYRLIHNISEVSVKDCKEELKGRVKEKNSFGEGLPMNWDLIVKKANENYEDFIKLGGWQGFIASYSKRGDKDVVLL